MKESLDEQSRLALIKYRLGILRHTRHDTSNDEGQN